MKKDSYFSSNSIGLSENRIGYYIGKETLDDHIEFLATNSAVSNLAMGQKNVNVFLKENRIGEKEVLKFQEFLGI